MKKIAVITATRAEYGLLSGLVKQLRLYENESFRVSLIVTGTHLYKKYGMTVNEIKNDGCKIDFKIKIPINSDSEADISYNQSVALKKFSELFEREHFDAVVLLGDRYETLAFAIAAGNASIPIIHLCGGDTTEGAIDEWIRHSITKMSYLHFPTNEESKKRIIQMGENPDRVFNFGSTSIDNILNVAKMSKQEALHSIGLNDCKYAICTYHPVTMEIGSTKEHMNSFLKAVSEFPEIKFIITKSNADKGGAEINAALDDAEKEFENISVFESLGIKRYLSLMRYSEFVLGNSSSGIIEAPAFHIPTVNIGDRQKGRLQVESILNCQPDEKSIIEAIKLAMSDTAKKKCQNIGSPYGDGNTAKNIAEKIYKTFIDNKIDLKKSFYNVCQ